MKILITGGASGLGKAITHLLAKDVNNTVYFTYYSSGTAAKEIETTFINTQSFKVDFRNSENIEKLLDQMNVFEPEVLINNAVYGFTQKHFHKFNSANFLNSFEINVLPVLMITQKFIQIRKKYNKGKIISILTSALVNKPPVGWSEYIANKAYLFSMAKSWATEDMNFGITSDCISPSFMQTNLTSTIDSRIIERMILENPNKQLLNENEVAEVVHFLVNCTTQINGHNIIINAASDII